MTGATITGLTVDAANVTGNLSASRINGGILDFNNFSVNHLSANDITTGLLSADYIKLGGDMAVYDALNSGTVGGWLGYTTGTYGGAGIHMQSGLGEVVATTSGAKLLLWWQYALRHGGRRADELPNGGGRRSGRKRQRGSGV